MNLLVDTSVWSLALRRDSPPAVPEVERLRQALEEGEQLVTTGLILQELLQGFAGPRDREEILARFRALPRVRPDLDDHVAAAGIRNRCRRRGIQISTIDALLAQLSVRHGLTVLTTDADFRRMARHTRGLSVWRPSD